MADFIKSKEIRTTPAKTPEVPSAPAPEQQETMRSRETAPQEAQKQPSQVPQQAVPQAQDHVSHLRDRVATPHTKSERLIEIEKIMSNNLEDIFAQLDPQTQEVVKKEGEQTATKIEQMIEQGKAIAKGVLGLIRGWLHKIPGMNKFFLEQESKLKTDKIMAIERQAKADPETGTDAESSSA